MHTAGRHRRRLTGLIAVFAGLTLVVILALVSLGWMVVSQERALGRQRAFERINHTAAAVSAGVLRRFAEMEAALAQAASASSAVRVPGAPGLTPATVVFERAGLTVTPATAVLYYPAVRTQPLDPAVFDEADRLEFLTQDRERLTGVLQRLAASSDEHARAEAFLRLARLRVKQGAVDDALDLYGALRDVGVIHATLEVPYALLARIERTRLLTRSDARRQELDELRAGLSSGRWPMPKASFLYYESLVRRAAGPVVEPAIDPRRLALSDAVGQLWQEWTRSPGGGLGAAGQRIFRTDQSTVLAIVGSSQNRLAAALLDAEDVRQLVRTAAADESDRDDLTIALIDERRRLVAGDAPASGAASPERIAVTRPIGVAGVPWQLEIATNANHGVSASAPHLIPSLAAVVLIVAVACYAMARGVIREWQTARQQSNFVSAVSHEFRSPLTSLGQLSELLGDGRIRDESRRQQYYQVLQRETARLQTLVENLLDFGRIDAGQRQYASQPVDFADLVRVAVREFQAEVQRTGYEVRLDSVAGDALIQGDREALRRVVRNLLENAVKYSPACRTVWVEIGQEDRTAVLRVRDHGIGIAADDQPRIFERFVRGEAAKRACIRGTGIGLAIVKDVVRAHAGEITLISAEGRGSTFTVRIPLAASAARGAA